MIHATGGYNIEAIPKDEPVFLLRAQDKFAHLVVRFWCVLATQSGEVATDMVFDAAMHAECMKRWPVKKIPDI